MFSYSSSSKIFLEKFSHVCSKKSQWLVAIFNSNNWWTFDSVYIVSMDSFNSYFYSFHEKIWMPKMNIEYWPSTLLLSIRTRSKGPILYYIFDGRSQSGKFTVFFSFNRYYKGISLRETFHWGRYLLSVKPPNKDLPWMKDWKYCLK